MYLDDDNSCPQYNSLNDIRLRKEALRKSIEADDKKIKTLWNSPSPSQTPSRKT